jgi:hypothetical protein
VSVVIAYIVDAFVFRIQADKAKKCEKHNSVFLCNCHRNRKKAVNVTLNGSEINNIKYETTLLDQMRSRKRRRRLSINFFIRTARRIDFDLIPSQREVNFTGRRLSTREDLSLQMYRSELQDWIDEREERLRVLRENPDIKESFKVTLWMKTKEFLAFLLE